MKDRNILQTSSITQAIALARKKVKDNLLFDSNITVSVSFSDVDNTINDGLTFSALINNETLPTTFTSTAEGKGDIVVGVFERLVAGSLLTIDSYFYESVTNKVTR